MSPNLLKVHPLFYDSLSGEFYPPNDPTKNSHTLGRLAISTVVKGNLISDPASTELRVFCYTPLWAPDVNSLVACEKDASSNSHTLALLQLEANNSQITFVDSSDNSGQGTGIAVIHDKKAYSLLPNELGEELISTRSRIANMAQKFFDLAVN